MAENTGNGEKAEKPEKAENAGEATKAEKADKAENAGEAENAEMAEKAEKAEKTEKAEVAAKAEKAEKTEKAEVAAKAEKADKAEKAEIAAQAADPLRAPREALRRLTSGESLSRAEAEDLFGRMMDGEVSDPLKAALLVALRMKGEQVAEIAGAAAAMRRRATPIPHRRPAVVDTCGTGGDGRGTFNISTAAALVAAAAGAPVAKHGNRSVSSRSGSADVLAALGLRLDEDAATAGRALEEVGICFLFAPFFHPGMREVMPVRRELALRTVFNVLGPLTNPAGARRQLMGVYAPSLVEPIARVLADLGSIHAMVVHGEDGLDEITTTGVTHVCEVRDGAVRSYTLEPETFGLARAPLTALAGGGPAENAALMRQVLAGGGGPLADITVLNAGAALYVGGLAADLAAGVVRARTVLESGEAAEKLVQLVRFLA